MGDMTKVCPYCGQILGAEETVCKKCGQIYAEPQQQAYTTNNNQNAQYNTANNQQVYTTNTQNQQAYITNNSHTVTEAPMAQAPVTVAVPPQKPKKKSGLIIGIIVAVLVIAAGVFAAVKFDLIGKVFK